MKTEAEKLYDKEYQEARDFVSQWLWNSEEFGDTRSCEKMNIEQCRDVAVMLVRFNIMKNQINNNDNNKFFK